MAAGSCEGQDACAPQAVAPQAVVPAPPRADGGVSWRLRTFRPSTNGKHPRAF